MSTDGVEVVVVGGGQAGVAMSEHLGSTGVPHVVLERGRIAEKWRSGRWDSLVTNGPAWHDRFPGLEFGGDPDAFVPKEQVADYFEAYAAMIGAPVMAGVEVTSVQKNEGRPGFTVETSRGTVGARFVVAATGPFQAPVIPPIVPAEAGAEQIHSAAYRNPGQLPAGQVLVVGAGSSGVQIAAELQRAGRQVYLSVGPHTGPRGATAAGTTYGGSASSASGTWRPLPSAPSTSRSRSAALAADTPSTSATWLRRASSCWAVRRPAAAGR